MPLDADSGDWNARFLQPSSQSEKGSTSSYFYRCVMFDVTLVQHEACFWVRSMSGLECEIDVLRSYQIDPGPAAQPVRAVVMVNWLVHYIPRVHTTGEVLYHRGNMVAHDLFSIRRGYI